MTILTIVLLKYMLVAQAAVGSVMALLWLRTDLRDREALLFSGLNGARLLSTNVRVTVDRFVLAAFVVLLMQGSVFMLSPWQLRHVDQLPAMILISRIGWNLLCGLLVAMLFFARRGRSRLDAYYDRQEGSRRRRTDDGGEGP